MGKTAVRFHLLPSWLRLPGAGLSSAQRVESAHDNHERLARVFSGWSILHYAHSCYKLAAYAKLSGKPELVTMSYSKIGFNCALFAMGHLGMRYIRLARAAAESCRRSDVLMLFKAHLGLAYYCLGRLDESERELRDAVVTLDKVGDWFGAMSHHVLRHIYTVRGAISQQVSEAEAEVIIGTACGDLDIVAWGHYGKADALARAGRIDEALDLAERAIESLQQRGSWAIGIAWQVLGFVRLQASDYAGARAALEQSRATVRRTLALVEFVGSFSPLLVESLLGPRWADAEAEGGPSRTVARQAWRESRFARFIGWRFPNYRAHAWRVSGRAAFARGRTRTASLYFERAITAAEALGARYDLARSLLDAARVLPDRTYDYRRRGQQILDELRAVVPEAERLPS
jgi:tetratricopeptide (TPR) repeat protein